MQINYEYVWRWVMSLCVVLALSAPRLVLGQSENIGTSNESASYQSASVDQADDFDQIRRDARARAMDRQAESINFSTVLTAEILDRFTDYTVEDALIRFPGVQAGRRGNLGIRGTNFSQNYVTVDGHRMASSGLGDRSTHLGGISVDMIEKIEVNKVVTPDMDADALGGVINLVTKELSDDREFSSLLGGGVQSRYLSHAGINGRTYIKYADQPIDEIFVSANVNFHQDQRGWESLDIAPAVADFGNGPVDVIDYISPAMFTDGRNRIGGSLQLYYQPSERATYHIRGMLNHGKQDLIRHRTTFNTAGDWVDQNSTGSEGGRGTFDYDVLLQQIDSRQYTVNAGGRHLFDQFNLEYNLNWGYGLMNLEEDQPFFQAGSLDYTIDWEDRNRPALYIEGITLQRDGSVNPRSQRFQYYDRIQNRHEDNNIAGSFDIEVPFGIGAIEFGSSARVRLKDGFFSDSRYTFLSPMSVYTFRQVRHGGIEVFDREEYEIHRFVDPYGARDFYSGNRPNMFINENRHYERSEIWNYSALENIYAGYGMATINMGLFTLMGGGRLEHMDARYDGRRPRFDDSGTFRESADTSQSTGNTHLFPNAQVHFSPSDRTNIVAAYTETIARPHFSHLAPFELTHVQDTTLFRGNADLEPMTSRNLNLILEHYFPNAGNFSLGLFHKQLAGFIFERRRAIEIEEGDVPAFDGFFDEETSSVSAFERSFQNGDETAEIYGVEVSWYQSLSYLPGFLGNLGVFGNYTWMHSVYDVDFREDEVRLPGQRPHVVNAALDYSQGRFATQLTYHWSAEAINGLQDTRTLAPSINTDEAVYMDRFEDGWKELSFSFRFRISDHFRFWADVSNILESERYKFDHSLDHYPVSSDIRKGRTFNLGIRYDL